MMDEIYKAVLKKGTKAQQEAYHKLYEVVKMCGSADSPVHIQEVVIDCPNPDVFLITIHAYRRLSHFKVVKRLFMVQISKTGELSVIHDSRTTSISENLKAENQLRKGYLKF